MVSGVCVGLYGWYLPISDVFVCAWGVIWVLIPCRVDNTHCFGIALKHRFCFTWPQWYIKISKCPYDKVSDQPFIWVREMDESESGQILLEKVKWTFYDAYLWQTMWNHAKKSMEVSKLSDSVFLQCDVRSSVLKTPKNTKKHQNLRN